MKLIDLVKAIDWPKGANFVMQDSDGIVKYSINPPCTNFIFGGSKAAPDRDGDWQCGPINGRAVCSPLGPEYVHWFDGELADDWETAVISREAHMEEGE